MSNITQNKIQFFLSSATYLPTKTSNKFFKFLTATLVRQDGTFIFLSRSHINNSNLMSIPAKLKILKINVHINTNRNVGF